MRGQHTSPFAQAEQRHQEAFRADSSTFTEAGRRFGCYRDRIHPAYIPEECWTENLYPGIRDEAVIYFAANDIAWHQHANHVRSSQICCINFLMPLGHNEETLIAALEPALGPIARIVPIEPGRLVAFEWIGEADYLNESIGPHRLRRRGEHCTSADAAVRLLRADGTIETVLIEWKYTETYQSETETARREKQLSRYGAIAIQPEGPLRADLGILVDDLFYEPVYQLLRTPATRSPDREGA